MNVLFVCLQNAGRSQISQALFELAAAGRHQARSAGTTPAREIHPNVAAAMGELGIDLAGRRPKQLTRELVDWAEVVVTMGCGDQCPYVPGRRYVEWELADPSGQPIAQVRRIRDEIAARASRLAIELDSVAASRSD